MSGSLKKFDLSILGCIGVPSLRLLCISACNFTHASKNHWHVKLFLQYIGDNWLFPPYNQPQANGFLWQNFDICLYFQGNRGGLLGVSGSKSAASKAGRATALAMAKRGIARWKHFVETGESCFTEAGLREVLLCISSKDGETKAFPSCAEFRASINSVGLSLMGFLELKLAGLLPTRKRGKLINPSIPTPASVFAND